MFTADPSAHVFNDKLYIYPSHDIPHDGEDNDNGDEYQMRDYHVLSMDSLEGECVDNGLALSEGDGICGRKVLPVFPCKGQG